MKVILALAVLCAASCYAQAPLIANQSEAEAGTEPGKAMSPLGVAQWFAVNGGALASACGYEKTSATRLTVFPGATAGAPCVVGDRPWQFAAPQTVDISGTSSSGTGYVYVDSAGALTFAHNTATTFTPSAGIVVVGSTSAWPTAVARLFTPSWTANVFDIEAVTKDLRSPLATNRAISCTGCSAQSTNADGAFAFTVPTLTAASASLTRVTGISSTSNANSVGTMTLTTSQLTNAKSVDCEAYVVRTQVGGSADVNALNLGWTVGGVAVAGAGGHATTGSGWAARFWISIIFPTSATQWHFAGGNLIGGALASLGGVATSGMTGGVDTTTTDLTIQVRVWLSAFTDDTANFEGSRCVVNY
jgi:hypothetical protein